MSDVDVRSRGRAGSGRSLAGALLFCALPAIAAWGDGYEELARDVSRAAGRAAIARVAVAPFEPAEGGEAREGWLIAERLTTELVRLGRLQVVERNLLGKVLEEQRLMRAGAVDSAQAGRLGALSPAEGIVTGSFVAVGGRLMVEARLIELKTGLIIAAARDEAGPPGLGAPAPVPAGSRPGLSGLLYPAFNSNPPTEFLEGPLADFLFQPPSAVLAGMALAPAAAEGGELRDALADGCAQAAQSADEMEARILDLKAHYWALRLKRGRSGQDLKADPGSGIADPELKRRFYSALRSWTARDLIPELDVSDVLTVLMIGHKASALRRNCRT
jgi:TolB-like protein